MECLQTYFLCQECSVHGNDVLNFSRLALFPRSITSHKLCYWFKNSKKCYKFPSTASGGNYEILFGSGSEEYHVAILIIILQVGDILLHTNYTQYISQVSTGHCSDDCSALIDLEPKDQTEVTPSFPLWPAPLLTAKHPAQKGCFKTGKIP